jgi:hypothetical protein
MKSLKRHSTIGNKSVQKTRKSSVKKTRKSSVKKTRKSSVKKTRKSSVKKTRKSSVKKPRKSSVNKTRKPSVKKNFLFNPDDPKRSFDVYIDKNHKDTIKIKYTTVEDVKNTISKLERMYKNKKYSHKRIWQVGMIMMVRLRVLKNTKPKQFGLANKYFKFLGKRTKLTEEDRRKLKFD